jgi:hypothetical protein
MSTMRDRSGWTRSLTEFNRENEGRPVRVEIDTARLGAQMPGHDLPFRGAAYDPRDDRVEIMLGSADHAAHVTHTIEHPERLDVLPGQRRRGAVLRIVNPDGQTFVVARGTPAGARRWRNAGPADRAVRVTLGLALLLIAGLDAGVPLAWLGVALLATGISGWCPLYTVLGIRTAQPRKLRPGWRDAHERETIPRPR